MILICPVSGQSYTIKRVNQEAPNQIKGQIPGKNNGSRQSQIRDTATDNAQL
jgi:hypothetical protein